MSIADGIYSKVELLSPAGDFESMKAAVTAGADAVYAGGKAFGARAKSTNFTNEELERAADYCHIRDAKLYVTVNTLINDSELEEAVSFAAFLESIGIDALIVQDIGLARAVRSTGLEIPMHLSTQSAIFTHHDLEPLKALGFSRVILPRELAPEQIRTFSENTSLELECFVHGALCVSCSGRCFFSALNGGRSGNRGSCAQVCRKDYTTYVDGKTAYQDMLYILSTADLCSAFRLEDIISLGVTSLKIEGRMKNPDYVYTVTNVYKKALDYLRSGAEFDREKAAFELRQVFARRFTGGYVSGEKGAAVMNRDIQKPLGEEIATVSGVYPKKKLIKLKLSKDMHKGDGTDLGEDIGRIVLENGDIADFAGAGMSVYLDCVRPVQKGKIVRRTKNHVFNQGVKAKLSLEKRAPIDAQLSFKIGEKPSLLVSAYVDGVYFSAKAVSEKTAEKAVKAPLSRDDIISRVKKTGDTPFDMNLAKVEIDGGAFFPLGELSRLRRRALADLENRIYESYKKKLNTGSYKCPAPNLTAKNEKLKFYIKFKTKAQLEFIRKSGLNAAVIASGRELYTLAKAEFEECYMALKPITDYSNYEAQKSLAEFSAGHVFADSLAFIGNGGIAGPYLNVYNSESAGFFAEKGAKACMSYELAFAGGDGGLEIMPDSCVIVPAYAYPALMTTPYCPHKGADGGCNYGYNCKLETTFIKNRQGDIFAFENMGGCMTKIYSKTPYKLSRSRFRAYVKSGFQNFLLELEAEDDEALAEIFDTYNAEEL